MRVERKREVSSMGGGVVEIIVTKRGELYINGVNKTEEFHNRAIDGQLMDELELRAEAGHFDDTRYSLLSFLKA
jgi:hypothetical protein